MTRHAASMLLLISAILPGGTVTAQNFPTKPIRLIAPEPGGGGDMLARLIAQEISGPFGQQVIVDNRGGAGGAIAADMVAKAPPDGYTLLFFGSGVFTLPLMKALPYDPAKDFFPVTLADRSPNILVVHPSVAATSIKELIALAKAKPGTLNYAMGSTGSPGHLATELLKSMAGVDIVGIPFKGTGPAGLAVLSGQVQIMINSTGTVAPHIKSGKLRALAVTSAEPSELAPGIPTLAATLPGFESVSSHGVYAPARTPTKVIDRLNQEIVRALRRPDVKARFFNAGFEVVASTPEQFAAAIKTEMTKMGKVIKDAGIRLD